MKFYTLDQIVRGLLIKEAKTLHSYIQYLSYACSGLQRLNTTTLKNVNSKSLPVTSYNAVILPQDYVDFVQVGFQVGERVRPMIANSTLNRLNNYDSTGAKVVFPSTFPDGSQISDESGWAIDPNYPLAYYLNEPFYQNIAFFNRPVDRDDFMFKILPERNEIQLSTSYPYDTIVLDYITDGLSSDAATKIDPLATAALEKYILWQSKVHSRTANEGERMAAEKRFTDEWRFLRAARNPLTKADVLHAVRSGYSGTTKP